MSKDGWLLAQAKSPRKFLLIMLFALAIGLVVCRWLAPMSTIYFLGGFFAVVGWVSLSIGGARIVEKAILGAWGALYPIWSATIYWTVERMALGEQAALDSMSISPMESAIVGGISMLVCGALTSVILLLVTRSIRPSVWCIVATALAALLIEGVRGAENALVDLLGSMRMYWDLRSLTNFVSILLWHGLTLWGLLSWARPRALRSAGLCLECAYDLEGVEGETCPECGASTKASA